jgi:hypothetical protein
MDSTRRDFVQHLAIGAAALTGVPSLSNRAWLTPSGIAAHQGQTWDVSWANRITNRHKTVFDCAEVESGYGVWRLAAWAGQYMDVMKLTAAQLSPVLILRHNAIALAMNQAFWDKYGIGKLKQVTHPLTQEPTTKNPALLDERDGIPAPFNNAGLHKQLQRGVIVLACNLALRDCVELVKSRSGLNDEDARKEAIAALVPGVILQPSGVFAAVRAQEAGCSYVKAS